MKNLHIEQRISLLLNSIQKPSLIKNIFSSKKLFSGDPSEFFYSMSLFNINSILTKNAETSNSRVVNSSGVSLYSYKKALLKCLAEGIERICLNSFNKKGLKYHTSKNIGIFSLKKMKFIPKIGWIEGNCLTNNKRSQIPAQLVSFNYKPRLKKETSYFINTSTGAACEFSLNQSLLNGIYEVIERDAFMTIYLNKISPPNIDVSKIENKKIKELIALFRESKLKWFVLDFTTDVKIPVIVSLLVDKFGSGPCVSFGAKCSFNQINNIIASAEEALMLRGSGKAILNANVMKKLIGIENKHLLQRVSLWWPKKMLKKINFLILSPYTNVKKNKIFPNRDIELKYVISTLSKNGHIIYYKDITLNYFKKLGLTIVKVLIPTMQSLYLNEKDKIVNTLRIKSVAKYFGVKNSINKLPHPFL